MFDTELTAIVRAALLVLCMGSHAAMAQTIEQIADAQRAKVAEELRLATSPVPAPPASAAEPQSRMPSVNKLSIQKVEPVIVVYGLYIREGKYVAELTDGRKLVTAAPGMRFKRMKIELIDANGVHLQAVGKCKKRCALKRVVAVGGEL